MSICQKCHRTIKGTTRIASAAASMKWCACPVSEAMQEPPLASRRVEGRQPPARGNEGESADPLPLEQPNCPLCAQPVDIRSLNADFDLVSLKWQHRACNVSPEPSTKP